MAQAHRKTWNGAAIAAPQAATMSPIFSQFMSSLPGLTTAGVGLTFGFISQRSYTITSLRVTPAVNSKILLRNRYYARRLTDSGSIRLNDFETYAHVTG